jgi:hypothetical protein
MTTGTLYSFSDTGNNMRSIADVVNMIDWQEAPLLRIFGFNSANVKKFRLVNWPALKAELIEDTMPSFTTTLAEEIDGTTEDAWTVAASTGQYFRTGDLIGVEDANGQILEKAVVDSVSTDTITVKARGYGATSATLLASGLTVRLLTRVMPEGANYTTGYTTSTTQPYNEAQIISEAVKVTKTALAVQKYGIDDLMDYQVAKLFADGGAAGRLAQYLERTFYYGERVARDGSNDGSMGGFETLVTTNVTDLNQAAITKADIHTKVRQIRVAGGKVTHLITGAWGMEKLTSMYEDTIQTTRDETIGGSEIQTIMTPHGKVKLVYAWMCPEDRYYFVNADKAGWLPLRDFARGKIAEQGDFFVSDVVGEYTFLVASEKSHGLIKEASTTS